MKFNEHDESFTLSTGRVLIADARLSPGTDGRLYEGYDARVHELDANGDEAPLTPAERSEIAEYMIERWREWAKR
jgi:hypothetical protein